MKLGILFSLVILISIGILHSCNDELGSREEIIITPPEASIEVDPFQGYYELNTSFSITSQSHDKNTSKTDLELK